MGVSLMKSSKEQLTDVYSKQQPLCALAKHSFWSVYQWWTCILYRLGKTHLRTVYSLLWWLQRHQIKRYWLLTHIFCRCYRRCRKIVSPTVQQYLTKQNNTHKTSNVRVRNINIKSQSKVWTPTHSRVFLYLYYFLHCRITLKTSKLWNNTRWNM